MPVPLSPEDARVEHAVLALCQALWALDSESHRHELAGACCMLLVRTFAMPIDYAVPSPHGPH